MQHNALQHGSLPVAVWQISAEEERVGLDVSEHGGPGLAMGGVVSSG